MNFEHDLDMIRYDLDMMQGRFPKACKNTWGLSKIMVPENALMPRFREPFAPFRAPAESGHEIMIRFSFTYKFINIMVFTPFANLTPPFRGLSPLQQNIHIHICRCHSDTKSLAWVLGRLPHEDCDLLVCLYQT